MSTRAVTSVNSRAAGERRILPGAPTSASAPAASSTTDAAVAADALLEVWENHGSRVQGFRADGRIVIPALNAPPATLHDDDFWIELVAGVPTLKYRHAGTTVGVGGSSGSGAAGTGFAMVSVTNGLAKGHCVRTMVSGPDTKIDLADAGTGSVINGRYRVAGILAATVTDTVNPFDVALNGQRITLTSGELNFIASTTALLPGQNYFLSRTGRWTTDPLDVAGGGANPVEAVVRVGRALTPDTLLVDISMAVIRA